MEAKSPTTTITTIPTTLSPKIPTTTFTTFITTIPKTPTTIPTTIQEIIPTSILTTIPKINIPSTTINKDKCVYGAVITQNCVFINMTSNAIVNKVKNEVLDTYPQDGIDIVIPAPDNFAFQLTSSSNELTSLEEGNDNGMSKIKFGDCENLLRESNGISKNASFGIFSLYSFDIFVIVFNVLK
jgi:hypothetical protein